jgi:protein-disulfide isomerase
MSRRRPHREPTNSRTQPTKAPTRSTRWMIAAGVVLLLAAGLALAVVAAQTPVKIPAVAEINGVAVSAEEVDKAIGPQIAKLEEQIYQLRQQRIEALVREKLIAGEAAKRHISVQSLLDAEVTRKVKLVTDQEIETVYQANTARLQGEASSVRDRIRSQLQNQKLSSPREAFIRSLRSEANVAVHLNAPPVRRADVTVAGAFSKRPASAPVTIVEFSDFHCPFCKRVEDTVAQVLSRCGDTVQFVFRDFPIDQLHPQSRLAHEAARCAGEQGKFWEYHKLLFEGTPKSGAEQLKAVAEQAGLGLPAFEQCLSSGRYKATIQKDIAEGSRLGVNGTPAFFINGRELSGSQPLESFARVIDDELSRTAQTASNR